MWYGLDPVPVPVRGGFVCGNICSEMTSGSIIWRKRLRMCLIRGLNVGEYQTHNEGVAIKMRLRAKSPKHPMRLICEDDVTIMN